MFDFYGVVAEKKYSDNKKKWYARLNFLGFNLSAECTDDQAENLKIGQLVKCLVIGTPKAKDNYSYIMPEVVGLFPCEDMKDFKKILEFPTAKITVINAKKENLKDSDGNEVNYGSMLISGELSGTFTGVTDFVEGVKNWGKYEIGLNIISKKGVVQIYPSNFKEIS